MSQYSSNKYNNNKNATYINDESDIGDEFSDVNDEFNVPKNSSPKDSSPWFDSSQAYDEELESQDQRAGVRLVFSSHVGPKDWSEVDLAISRAKIAQRLQAEGLETSLVNGTSHVICAFAKSVQQKKSPRRTELLSEGAMGRLEQFSPPVQGIVLGMIRELFPSDMCEILTQTASRMREESMAETRGDVSAHDR